MPRVMDVAKVNASNAEAASLAKDVLVAKGDAPREAQRSDTRRKAENARDRIRTKIANDVLAKQDAFAKAYEAALASLLQFGSAEPEQKAREIALDVSGLRETLALVSKYDMQVRWDRKGFAIEDNRDRNAKAVEVGRSQIAKLPAREADKPRDDDAGDLASRLVTGESWDAIAIKQANRKASKREADYRTPEALLGYMRSLVNFSRAIAGDDAKSAIANLAGQLAFVREGGLQPFCAFEVTEALVDRLCGILEHEAANPTSVKGRMRFEEVAVYIPKRKDSRASVWAMDMATRLMVRLES